MSVKVIADVWQHSQAKGTARLVILALADHADHDGFCWPSLTRIATYCKVNRANVSRNLKKLIESGEVQRITPGNQNTTTKYRVQVGAEAHLGAVAQLGVGAEAHHEPSIYPSIESIKGETPENDYFDEFWKQYPRKVAKAEARKAYVKALGKSSHEEIMAGLARYDPDPEYTCHPTTWLNQERWTDEPDRRAKTVIAQRVKRGQGGGEITDAYNRFRARRKVNT